MKEQNWQRLIGVYEIICNATDAHYIGRSVNIEKRWRRHKEDLKANKHHSVYLQRSWNKHGSENFEFKILEETTIDALKEREIYYLKTIPGAFNMVGHRTENDSTMFHSAHSRAAMTAAQKANWEKRRKEGRDKLTQAHKDAIAAGHKGKKATDETKQILKAAFKNRKPPPKKTHCKRGHELTPENRVDGRSCKICDRERKAKWAKQKRINDIFSNIYFQTNKQTAMTQNYMPLKTFMNEIGKNNFTGVTVNGYLWHYVTDAMKLAEEVSTFYPAMVMVNYSKNKAGSPQYHFEHAYVFLIHPMLQIKIEFNQHKKKYSIFCLSCNEVNEHLSGYDIQAIQEEQNEPNQIGILNDKKLKRWIEYWERVYDKMKEKNAANGDKIKAFIDSLAGLDVHWWDDNKRGSVTRNGIVFTFEIVNNHVATEIKLEHRYNKDLSTFLKLSDNALKNEPVSNDGS